MVPPLSRRASDTLIPVRPDAPHEKYPDFVRHPPSPSRVLAPGVDTEAEVADEPSALLAYCVLGNKMESNIPAKKTPSVVMNNRSRGEQPPSSVQPVYLVACLVRQTRANDRRLTFPASFSFRPERYQCLGFVVLGEVGTCIMCVHVAARGASRDFTLEIVNTLMITKKS